MTPAEYDYLRQFLKKRSGLVLSDEKQYLVDSRLMPVARKAGLKSIAQLIGKLREPAQRELAEAVVDAMTTNESFFFRDKAPFDNFASVMLPNLIERRALTRTIRIWCAAASTGQEPYSLAMILREHARSLVGWRVDILATDISSDVLEKAKAGLYSQFEVQRGLPIQYLVKYFTRAGELWQISPDIRTMVQFRKLNLLESLAGLGPYDIVFCRNVLIYFDAESKADTLARIAKVMRPDGYLVLGAAETVIGLCDAFRPATDRHGLYTLRAPAPAETL